MTWEQSVFSELDIPTTDLCDGLANSPNIPVHVLQFIYQAFRFLGIRKALLDKIILFVSSSSRETLHWYVT
jgi:hypothetical protein